MAKPLSYQCYFLGTPCASLYFSCNNNLTTNVFFQGTLLCASPFVKVKFTAKFGDIQSFLGYVQPSDTPMLPTVAPYLLDLNLIILNV